MISPRVLIRKLLGRRGTFLLRNVASTISYTLGIYEYADSTGRRDGISAMVCSYNEEDWIEPSLLSIKDLVDEYVIVDSSTDRTPEIIEELRRNYGLNMRVFRVPPGSLSDARLTAVVKASYKWILHWDPDFIAYEFMPSTIKTLIEGLDRRRHYLVYWKYLLLCGNLRHLCSSTPYHIEHWLFTYSRRLTYKDLNIGGGKITDLLIAPLGLYKPIYLDKVLGIHLGGIRNPERIAIKHIWYIYRNEFTELAREGYDFKELAMRYAEKLYGTKDLRVVGKKLIEDAVRSLPKYSEDVYGPLPRVLKDYVDRRIREDPEFIEVVGS